MEGLAAFLVPNKMLSGEIKALSSGVMWLIAIEELSPKLCENSGVMYKSLVDLGSQVWGVWRENESIVI
jgi:hypothetical protein